MTLSDFIIGFRRKKILVKHDKPQEEPRPDDFLRKFDTLNSELSGYGYQLSPVLKTLLAEEDLGKIYDEIIRTHLDTDLGFSGTYTLRYPGFPQQVMDKDEWELMKEAEDVYNGVKSISEEQGEWDGTGGLTETKGEKKMEILEPMSYSEFLQIPVNLFSTGSALSPINKEELIWFCENKADEITLPDKIPFKENLALAMRYFSDVPAAGINDVLRFAMVTVGVNSSLPKVKKTQVKTVWYRRGRKDEKYVTNPDWRKTESFTCSHRRKVMSLIEGVVSRKGLGGTIPDAKTARFYGHWLFLNERIHPQSYRKKYPKAAEFFHTLLTKSENKKWPSWNSKLQGLYKGKKTAEEITKFVSDRPGELVRRLDSLLRRGMQEGLMGEVFDVFLDTEGMNNKTLMELFNYYDTQRTLVVGGKEEIERTIKINGEVKKIPNLPKLPVDIREEVTEFIIRKILINIDRRQDKDGMKDKTVYIDPAVKDIPLPTAMRWSDASLPAGTVFEIPADKKYMTVFTQWIQGDNGPGEDLDIHAYFYNTETKKLRNIGWNTGLKGDDLCALHSGDVLDIPGECQETILIDLERSLKAGYEYVVFTVRNYKGRDFTTLPAWLGFDFVSSFKAIPKNQVSKNPEFKTPLNLKTSSVSAFLLDLKERRIKVCSYPLDEIPTFTTGQNEEGIVYKFKDDPKFTCYDILRQYYISSGATVLTELPKETEDDDEKEILPEIEYVMKENILVDIPLIQKIIGE